LEPCNIPRDRCTFHATKLIKLSRLFNEDIERGVPQKDLSQQYGYAKQRVSEVVFIYPRLKDAEVLHVGLLSNHDLVQLARVECDAFKCALEGHARS